MFWQITTAVFAAAAFAATRFGTRQHLARIDADRARLDSEARADKWEAEYLDLGDRWAKTDAENAALRSMISSKDPDLHAAWRDACRERDAAIEHAQQVVVELQELRRRFARAVGHPSADGDPTPAHGIERPALKIVEGL